MKIIVDAMGGDNAPLEIVRGAALAAEEFQKGIVLVGRGEDILRSFEQLGMKDIPQGMEVANATEVVEMEDEPSSVTRTKTDSSMTVGLKLLHNGDADAMVSAGSTGALLSGATIIVKRIHGIRRAALAPVIPTNGNGGTLIVDVGANAECTSEYLLQFAYMGYFFAKTVLRRDNPKVGLLNIGVEESKGNALYKETYGLLRAASEEGRINFTGNVEARDVMDGICDVIVCDGFTGNVLLKCIEGMGGFFSGEIKRILSKSAMNKLAASIIKKDVSELRKRMDPSEIGGTALLGITKPVIKAHGSSDAYAIRSAVRQAIVAAESDVSKIIEANIKYMKVPAQER